MEEMVYPAIHDVELCRDGLGSVDFLFSWKGFEG